jgi:mRNA interferase RelE/StbE
MMTSYKIVINKSVRKKDLAKIPKADVKKIVDKIRSLAHNPRPVDAIRLRSRNEWRIRQGNYRILYLIEENIVTVVVVKVGHRRDVYKS